MPDEIEATEAPETGSVNVEELNIQVDAPPEAPQEPEAPRDDLETGYRYGLIEARMQALENDNAALRAQLAAFEQATIAAVEMEQAELEQQASVLADVAEEVLASDHDGANALDPTHSEKKPRLWEALLGGRHQHKRIG